MRDLSLYTLIGGCSDCIKWWKIFHLPLSSRIFTIYRNLFLHTILKRYSLIDIKHGTMTPSHRQPTTRPHTEQQPQSNHIFHEECLWSPFQSRCKGIIAGKAYDAEALLSRLRSLASCLVFDMRLMLFIYFISPKCLVCLDRFLQMYCDWWFSYLLNT